MRKKVGVVCWGIALLAVGVGLGGAAIGAWNFHLFFRGWWTLFLIIPALIMMVQHGPNIGNMIMLALGALLLLGQQGILPGDTMGKLIAPAILVIVGLGILWRVLFPSKARAAAARFSSSVHQQDAQDAPVYNAVFSSQSVVSNSQDFKGAKLTAVFGGIEFDMRDAVIKEEAVLTCTAVFGGIEVIVPRGVRIEMSGTPVFGGNSCTAAGSEDTNAPKLIVQGTAIFGGNEFK